MVWKPFWQVFIAVLMLVEIRLNVGERLSYLTDSSHTNLSSSPDFFEDLDIKLDTDD